MHFKMSSAICFNLDQSKILSFGLARAWRNVIVVIEQLDSAYLL